MLDESEELDDVKVCLEFSDTFIQIEVSLVLAILLEGFRRPAVSTPEIVSECVTQVVLEIPAVHGHLVDEVQLLPLRLLANWPCGCIPDSTFDGLFISRGAIEGLDLAIRISQTPLLLLFPFLARCGTRTRPRALIIRNELILN